MTVQLIIIALFYLYSLVGSQFSNNLESKCHSVVCSSSKSEASVCFSDENDQYLVNSCDSSMGQICLITHDLESILINKSANKLEERYYCSKKQQPVAFLGMPDEACDSDSDCFSESCVNNKCQGLDKDQECDVDKGKLCSSGMFCNMNASNPICQTQIKPGGQCSDSYQCGNDAFCFESTCIQYLSVKKEMKAPLFPGSQINYLCESFYSNSKGVCSDPPQASKEASANFSEIKCNNDKDCYPSGFEDLEDLCACNFAEKAEKFCALPPSHIIYDLIKELFKKLISSNVDCISALRFDVRCGTIKEVVQELTTLLTYVRLYQKTINPAPCTDQIFFLPNKDRIIELLGKYNRFGLNLPLDKNGSSNNESNNKPLNKNESSANDTPILNPSTNEKRNETQVQRTNELEDSTLKKELIVLFYSVIGCSVVALICIIFCRYRKRLSKAGVPNLLARSKNSVKNEFKMQVEQILALDEEKHENMDDSRNEMNLNKKSSKSKKKDFQQLELNEEHNLTAKNVFNIEGEEEGGFPQKKNLDIILNDSNLSEASELSQKKGENSMSNIWK